MKDYGKTEDITDPELVRRMEEKLSEALKENEAPSEQWERLGLKK